MIHFTAYELHQLSEALDRAIEECEAALADSLSNPTADPGEEDGIRAQMCEYQRLSTKIHLYLR